MDTATARDADADAEREREDGMMEEACAGTCAHHSAGLRAKKVVLDEVAIGVERSQRLRSHRTGLCGARATAWAAAGGSRGRRGIPRQEASGHAMHEYMRACRRRGPARLSPETVCQ